MSALNLLNSKKNGAAFQRGYVTTDTMDVAGAMFTNTRQNYNTDSEIRLVGEPLNQRNSLIQQRFGKDIFQMTGTDQKYSNPTAEGRIQQLDESNNAIDGLIIEGRKTDPARWDGIQTTAEIKAKAKDTADQAAQNAAEIADRNPSALSRSLGSLAGGLTGAMSDPYNIATLPLGAGEMKIVGSGAMATARALAFTAAKEGTIQAAVQAASIPAVAHWQKSIGHEYGLGEAATDVSLGFAGGAVLRAAGEGVMPALRTVSSGGKKISAYAIGKIEQHAPNVGQTLRDSLKYMERTAYVDEGSPIPITNREELAAHREAAQEVVDKIQKYDRPTTDMKNISKITTPRNELEIEAAARVVDLSELVTSDMKNFDQSLQPRDRSNRVSSDARINEIAAKLDPAQLASSRVSNTGSPIVGPDMMVESGNGRVMALRKAYEQHPERAQAYRNYLESQGYDTSGMANPVLVRQRVSELTADERKKFVIFSNEDVADRLSTTERAMADAKLMTPAMMAAYRGGDIELATNAKFVRSFVDQAVSPAERNSFVTPKGELSQEGSKRLRSALLAKAYNDAPLVQKIMEDADNEIKTIGRVLMDISAEWSNLRADIADGHIPPVYDINKDLMDAVRTVILARQENKPITDFTGQTALFASSEMSAETRAILAGWYDKNGIKPLGYDKTKDFMTYYMNEVSKIQSGPGLFVQEPITPFDIMNTYLERQGKSLSLEISSGGKRLPLKKTSAGVEPGTHLPSSKTSEETRPFSFGRKRAMTPPSKRTGDVSKDGFISDTPTIKSYHNTDDIATISKKAKELKPELEDFLNYIISGVDGATFYGVRLKETDSLNLKLGRGKTASQVSDYIGGRIVVESQAALDHVMSNFRKAADIMEVDDFMDGSKASGYRAIHLQLNSDKGISAEVQIQPAPIRAVQDEAHIIYKKWQNVKELPMEGIQDAMRAKEMFDQAWAKWETANTPVDPFDANAYSLSEYRKDPVNPPSEVKPSDKFEASKTRFAELEKNFPDEKITLDDGSVVSVKEFSAKIKEDENIIKAITSCRIS